MRLKGFNAHQTMGHFGDDAATAAAADDATAAALASQLSATLANEPSGPTALDQSIISGQGFVLPSTVSAPTVVTQTQLIMYGVGAVAAIFVYFKYLKPAFEKGKAKVTGAYSAAKGKYQAVKSAIGS